MGLKELIQSAIQVAKLPPVKRLFAVLIITNAIQFFVKQQSDVKHEAKEAKLEKEKDDCKDEKLALQKEYSDKVDSIRVQATEQTTKVLREWNEQVEEALREAREATKIQKTTLSNLRKK